MFKRIFHLHVLALAIASSSWAEYRRPNVIIILADDLGAEGLGCYGSTIYTSPNPDRMATEGMRFNNACATPLCTPTRVMLMSGTYPNRNGFRALIGSEDDQRMPAEIKTFGNYFKDAGYQTAMAGKWQLGQFDVYPNQPVEHGFDNYCMWTWFHVGEKGHWQKGTLWEDGTNTVLMVRAPGMTTAGSISTTPVSLLDLYPTIMELSGIKAPDYLDGYSLVPMLKDPAAKRPGPALSAYDNHMTVRTEQYRLIRYGDGSMELYDHVKDPNEWTNLATNPEYASILKEVAACLPALEDMPQMAPEKVRGKKKKV